MNDVDMNNEWRALQLRAEYLHNRCADEFEEYMHMVNCVGPNLKSLYMVEIGQYEYRVFELEIEIKRWKRRFTLQQQALNRGDKPDYGEIEKHIDKEFSDYMAQIREKQRLLQEAASNMAMGRLSEEETTAIRISYLNAVKKLHPDINPSLPEQAKELWDRIQTAYATEDWKELHLLSSMIDDVLRSTKRLPSGGCMDEMKEEIARLNDRLNELVSARVALGKKTPYCWDALLNDENAVAQSQKKLKGKIEALENVVAEYEQKWKG